MSLTISVHKIDPISKEIIEDVEIDPKLANDLAGFENWREVFYGSEILKDIECHILPLLLTNDLFVFGEDLELLKRDCYIILNHIYLVTEKTGIDPASIAFRINNILVAVDIALKLENGAVWIN